MTGIDATFLYLETAPQPMVINLLAVVDVADVAGGYSFDVIRLELIRRIKEIPQFRRKVYDSALNLGHPAWVEEYELDVDDHLHRHTLPRGASTQDLMDFCGEVASHPMDRAHPLWEAWVVEGVAEPDTVAIFFRAHHSLFDGVSGADLIQRIAGSSAKGVRDAALVRVEAGGRNGLQLVAGGAWDLVTRPLRIARLLPETLLMPLTMRPERGRSARSSRDEAMPAPFTAPRTVWNRTLTPSRSFAVHSVPLADLKGIAKAFDCTVNDVLLTVVAGGLRHYLEVSGDLPEASLVATVPVSVAGKDGEPGTTAANQLSAMFASLATDVADASERLRVISRRVSTGKKQASHLRPSLLGDWASLSPAMLVQFGMRAYGALKLADLHPVVHNLVVSNVPGPREEVEFLGARVKHLYPFGPVFHGAGLSVTVFSQNGQLDVGLIACEHLVPDPQTIVDGIVAAELSLLEAVETGGAQPASAGSGAGG